MRTGGAHFSLPLRLLPTRPTERRRSHFLSPEARVDPHPTGCDQRGKQEDRQGNANPTAVTRRNFQKTDVWANRRCPTAPGAPAFERPLPFLGAAGAPAAGDPKLPSTTSSPETIARPTRAPATPGWRLTSCPAPRRLPRSGHTAPSLAAASAPKHPRVPEPKSPPGSSDSAPFTAARATLGPSASERRLWLT